jgi:hypothetical protein
MSTSFTLMSDPIGDCDVALRFWAGDLDGQTVRFAFPEILFFHMKDVELVGGDGSTVTVQELFDAAETVDFLAADVSPNEHLSHGTHGAREQSRLAWEAS